MMSDEVVDHRPQNLLAALALRASHSLMTCVELGRRMPLINQGIQGSRGALKLVMHLRQAPPRHRWLKMVLVVIAKVEARQKR